MRRRLSATRASTIAETEQRHAPNRIPEEHVEPEERVRSEAEEGEHGKSAKIEAREGAATFLRAFELDCETPRRRAARTCRATSSRPAAKRACESTSSNPVVSRVRIMKVDDEHPEERHAS